MRKLLLPMVLCVPVAANADLLLLEYDGAVSNIQEEIGDVPDPYSVGDRISGHLIIDTSLPGPNRIPGRELGLYGGQPGGVDFITGRPHPSGDLISDAVSIGNNRPFATGFPTRDYFDVVDGASFEPSSPPESPSDIGPGPADGFAVFVTRYSSAGQLVRDNGLIQTFDVTPDEGTTLTGYIFRSLGAAAGSFRQVVDLTFSHVSLGVCHAPGT